MLTASSAFEWDNWSSELSLQVLLLMLVFEIEVQSNDGHLYILSCVSVWGKYVYSLHFEINILEIASSLSLLWFDDFDQNVW